MSIFGSGSSTAHFLANDIGKPMPVSWHRIPASNPSFRLYYALEPHDETSWSAKLIFQNTALSMGDEQIQNAWFDVHMFTLLSESFYVNISAHGVSLERLQAAVSSIEWCQSQEANVLTARCLINRMPDVMNKLEQELSISLRQVNLHICRFAASNDMWQPFGVALTNSQATIASSSSNQMAEPPLNNDVFAPPYPQMSLEASLKPMTESAEPFGLYCMWGSDHKSVTVQFKLPSMQPPPDIRYGDTFDLKGPWVDVKCSIQSVEFTITWTNNSNDPSQRNRHQQVVDSIPQVLDWSRTALDAGSFGCCHIAHMPSVMHQLVDELSIPVNCISVFSGQVEE